MHRSTRISSASGQVSELQKDFIWQSTNSQKYTWYAHRENSQLLLLYTTLHEKTCKICSYEHWLV